MQNNERKIDGKTRLFLDFFKSQGAHFVDAETGEEL